MSIINNLKDLRQLISLCRKTGVSDVEIQGIKLHLGLMPFKRNKSLIDTFPEASIPVPQYQPLNAQETSNEAIEPISMPDELSQEQLLFYSAKSEPQ